MATGSGTTGGDVRVQLGQRPLQRAHHGSQAALGARGGPTRCRGARSRDAGRGPPARGPPWARVAPRFSSLGAEARENLPVGTILQLLQRAVADLPDAFPRHPEEDVQSVPACAAPRPATRSRGRRCGASRGRSRCRLLAIWRSRKRASMTSSRFVSSARKRSPSSLSPSVPMWSSSLTAAALSPPRQRDRRPRQSRFLGDLPATRLAVQVLAQFVLHADHAREFVRPVQRQAHDPSLLREGGENGLPNPPHGVADELHALVRIELLRGGDETDVPLLHEIEEAEALVAIPPGDGDDEAEVRPYETVEGGFVAAPGRSGPSPAPRADSAWGSDLVPLDRDPRPQVLIPCASSDFPPVSEHSSVLDRRLRQAHATAAAGDRR